MKKQAGFAKIILLILVAFGIYCGFIIGRFYYDYYDLKSEAVELLRQAKNLNDDLVFQKFKSYINKTEMPIDVEEDVKFLRTDDELILKVNYEEVFELFGKEIHVFPFKVRESLKLNR